MNDLEIREALKHQILMRRRNKFEPLIIDEFAIEHGAARIDILVVNNILHGYEIKSDRDNLYRLPDQVRLYNNVFDRITLIVGYSQAYEALEIIPEWWGVKLVTQNSIGTIHFADARSPKNNPLQDKVSLIRLLWKEEALSFLEEIGGIEGYKSKPRSAIYKRISEIADSRLVHSKVCNTIKYRIMQRVAV
jgi:hypothetical protein